MGSCWQCLFLYFDIAADGLKEVIVNTYADITARMEEGTVNRFVIFTQFGVLLLSTWLPKICLSSLDIQSSTF